MKFRIYNFLFILGLRTKRPYFQPRCTFTIKSRDGRTTLPKYKSRSEWDISDVSLAISLRLSRRCSTWRLRAGRTRWQLRLKARKVEIKAANNHCSPNLFLVLSAKRSLQLGLLIQKSTPLPINLPVTPPPPYPFFVPLVRVSRFRLSARAPVHAGCGL